MVRTKNTTALNPAAVDHSVPKAVSPTKGISLCSVRWGLGLQGEISLLKG